MMDYIALEQEPKKLARRGKSSMKKAESILARGFITAARSTPANTLGTLSRLVV